MYSIVFRLYKWTSHEYMYLTQLYSDVLECSLCVFKNCDSFVCILLCLANSDIIDILCVRYLLFVICYLLFLACLVLT